MPEEHTASTIIILINIYKTKNQKKKTINPKTCSSTGYGSPNIALQDLYLQGKYTMPYFSNIKIYPFPKNRASEDLYLKEK